MKRPMIALSVVLSAVILGGCATTGNVGRYGPPVIVVQVEDQFDLRVQVWDRHLNGPFTGAKVTVIQTGDWSMTNASGWTTSLATPQNADNARIFIEWPVRSCYGCDYVWRSYERTVRFRHGVTEVRLDVDTKPPY